VPASLRFAVVRRLAWDNWHVRGGHDYPLADADRRFVAAADPYALRSLAGAHLETAWPIFLVYLVHVTRFEYETSRVGLDALRSVRAPEATRALVALTELGFEWPVFSGQLVNGESIDDATLARLLPSVREKGVRPLVVVLVMGRIDRDEVYELALESLKKWPQIVAPRLVHRPGPRTEAALRKHLGVKKLEHREAFAKALADLGDERAREIYEETSRRIDDAI
jgi:hypothetical protein